jgi:hypothetical protein
VGRDPSDLRMVGGGNDVAEGDAAVDLGVVGSPAWTKPDCLGGSDVVIVVMIASVTVLYFLLHSKYHNLYLDGGDKNPANFWSCENDDSGADEPKSFRCECRTLCDWVFCEAPLLLRLYEC